MFICIIYAYMHKNSYICHIINMIHIMLYIYLGIWHTLAYGTYGAKRV